MKIKRVAEEWEIWDEEEETTRSEEKVKKLVLEQFYKWINVFEKKVNVFEKKVSERMLTRKM